MLEPGSGLDGKLKTARKGVGDYAVTVTGVASHAGVDFSVGASAIVELARQIERIAGFTSLDRGITVNPGVISGGTRTNVVAASARADVDIRVARLKDAGYLEKCFRQLKPVDKRCAIQVTGGLNRPPMERTPAIRALFRHARGGWRARWAWQSGNPRPVADRTAISRRPAGRGRRRRSRAQREHPARPRRRPHRPAGKAGGPTPAQFRLTIMS